MTAQNKTTLKALFETGDTILQSSFENLIDSLLDIAETSAQTVGGPIIHSGAVRFDNTVSVAGVLNATAGLKMGGGNPNITGSIIVENNIFTQSYVSSAAARGTTAVSALIVTAYMTVLNSVVAGVDDAIAMGSNSSVGGVQHVINNTAVTARVFPSQNIYVGNTIDGTSVVALLPNQRMTVFTMPAPLPFTYNVQYTMVGEKASV